jgi:hypothetical protein
MNGRAPASFFNNKKTHAFMCKHTYIEEVTFSKSPQERETVDTRYGIVVDSHHGQQVLELVVKGNDIQDVVNLVLPSSPEAVDHGFPERRPRRGELLPYPWK